MKSVRPVPSALPIGRPNRLRRCIASLLAAVTVAAGFWAAVPAQAQQDPAPLIKTAVEKWLKGRYPVDGVRKTPMTGMYEVQVGNDLIYVDQTARYAFVEGQMVDLKDNVNLTQARMEDLLRIDFKSLPLDLAIKQVNGNGRRVLAVFEDPNCTYCRKLRADFDRLKDVTIYTFPYPILAPDSEVKSRKAWCAKDRAGAWNAMLARGTVPDNYGRCDNPVADVRTLGRELGIEATPTMFFPSGKRVPGAISLQQLEALLDSEQVPAATPAGKGAGGAAGTAPADKSPAAARRSAS